jgi:hypothetical protein
MGNYKFVFTVVIWMFCDFALMYCAKGIGIAGAIGVFFTAFLFIPLLGWQVDNLPKRHLRPHETQSTPVPVQTYMLMSTPEPLLQPIPEPTEPDVKEETSEELRMKALIESWKVREG